MHLPRHDNTGYFLTFQFAEAFDQIIDDAYWIDFFMWLGLYIFRVWNWEWLLLMAFREEFTIRCPYVYSYNHSKIGTWKSTKILARILFCETGSKLVVH